MTNPTPHGQVPEALIDLIDEYAETRHRYGGIYNARTEAARKAVIEALSGVQALSAAPEAFLKSVIALCSHRGYSPANIEAWDKDDKWIADLWRQAESMLAASPTPPAEQQAAPRAAPGEPRFNCWSTNEGDSWFDHPADAQAIYDCLGNDAKVGDEYELTAGWNSVTARYRITEVVGDGEEYEVECISHPRENTAPQQDAQEPVAYVHVPHYTVEGKVRPVVSFEKYQQDYDDGIYSTRIPLYTAPQPAPAPLSDDVVKDAARYRWLRENWFTMTSNYQRGIAFKVGESRWSDITEEELDAAIDALAAQGGK